MLSKSDVPAYNFFENFCESVILLEKPKSGEISDVPRLKVGDRGATAGWHTPCFHVNLHCVAFHTVATPPHPLSRVSPLGIRLV